MSDSDEIIFSGEDEESKSIDGQSEADAANLPSKQLTIEDSDESANDSFVVRKSIRRKKRIAIIDSDDDESDDEEEEYIERRALSPRTRMSITGVRPADLTSDSSEIEYSLEEAENSRESGASRQQSQDYSKDYSEEEDEEEEHDEDEDGKQQAETAQINSFLQRSAIQKSLDSEKSSCDSSCTADYASADDNLDTAEHPVALKMRAPINNAKESPLNAPRYSTQFKNDISEKLSSTIYQLREPAAVIGKTNISSDSDIVIVSSTDLTVELSSSDDADKENAIIKPSQNETRMSGSSSRKQREDNFLQPKISSTTGFKSKTPCKTPHKSTCYKYVSRSFYDKEVNKLTDLKAELLSNQRLLDKIANSLPDGGLQLSFRVDRLRADVEIKTNYLATLKIEDGSQLLAQQQPQQKPSFNGDEPNWDALSKAVNQIKPTHTGKQGLATFNNQKALTVERLKDLHGSLENRPAEEVLADDPKGLKVPLMDHQKHALAWMGWREKQRPHGGILADDMGLGKTLTMIALILETKNRDECEDEDDRQESESEDEETKRNHGWSSKGRNDFYHGGTLVVCPASLISQWESEVKSKVARHKLTVCVHHGNNRDTKPKHLRTYDMVVTTYNIVGRDHKTQGALFGMKWRRIILDEAHVVRNPKSKSSEGVCGLRGKYRWALTGTPIQNKEMDIYALLKFLRCTPFDDLAHWKRWIDKSAGGQQRLNTVMKTVMLRRTKSQLQLRGTLQCLPKKRIEFIEVELDKDEMNVYQKIMVYSRTLFAQFLYQRAERDTDLIYSAQANRPTYMQTKDPNSAYYKIHEKFTKLHQGDKNIKSHEILVLLLRLRQICCHPGLIDAMLENEDGTRIESDSDNDQGDIDLLAQLKKLAITDTSTGINNSGGSEALRPEDEVMAKASARVLQRSNPVFNFERPSSKMVKVLDTIKKHVLTSKDKAIVVSQWTSVLNILKTHLEQAGVVTLSLNGTIPVKNRSAIVTEFNNANSNTRVLLLSLTAGGVGLNLVGANHLLLIDLHWNPQLEAQAQDRIYRVGQEKNVVIYKFMCKDTVEERIRALQDHKMAIANGVLTGSKSAEGSKLTMDDLKGLFGM